MDEYEEIFPELEDLVECIQGLGTEIEDIIVNTVVTEIEDDDKKKYSFMKGENVVECLKCIAALLRKDDDDRERYLMFGRMNAVQNKLIPLLMTYSNDKLLIFHLLRVLTLLTMPVPMDISQYREHVAFQQRYKELVFLYSDGHKKITDDKEERNFINCLSILLEWLRRPLERHSSSSNEKKEGEEENEEKIEKQKTEDVALIELILTLFKNFLQVPDSSTNTSITKNIKGKITSSLTIAQTDLYSRIHDLAIAKLAQVNCLDLFILISSFVNEEFPSLNHLLLDIFYAIFRLETAKGICDGSSLASRLSGSYVIERYGGRKQFITSTDAFGFKTNGIMKLPNERSANNIKTSSSIGAGGRKKQPVKEPTRRLHFSNPVIAKALYECANSFIETAFTPLLSSCLTSLASSTSALSSSLLYSDYINFMHVAAFFVEFHRLSWKKERHNEKYDATQIFCCMQRHVFGFVVKQIREWLYQDTTLAKADWFGVVQATSLLCEMIMVLYEMFTNGDDANRETAETLIRVFFFERDSLELLVLLLREFDLSRASISHLSKLVRTIHYMLKLIKEFTKDNKLFMKAKMRKKHHAGRLREEEEQEEIAWRREDQEQEPTPQEEETREQSLPQPTLNEEEGKGQHLPLGEESTPQEEETREQSLPQPTLNEEEGKGQHLPLGEESTPQEEETREQSLTQPTLKDEEGKGQPLPLQGELTPQEEERRGQALPLQGEPTPQQKEEIEHSLPLQGEPTPQEEEKTEQLLPLQGEPTSQEEGTESISPNPILPVLGNNHGISTSSLTPAQEELSAVFGSDEKNDSDYYEPAHVEYTYEKCLRTFFHPSVIKNYILLLARYRSNSPEVNHFIMRFLHITVIDVDRMPYLWQISTFALFQTILSDTLISRDKNFDYMRAFIHQVLSEFFQRLPEQPILFVDVLFSKKQDVVDEILHPGEIQSRAERRAIREAMTKKGLGGRHHDNSNLVTNNDVDLRTAIAEVGGTGGSEERYTKGGKWTSEEDSALARGFRLWRGHWNVFALIGDELSRSEEAVKNRLKKLGFAKKKTKSSNNRKEGEREQLEEDETDNETLFFDEYDNGISFLDMVSPHLSRAVSACRQDGVIEGAEWILDKIQFCAVNKDSFSEFPLLPFSTLEFSFFKKRAFIYLLRTLCCRMPDTKKDECYWRFCERCTASDFSDLYKELHRIIISDNDNRERENMNGNDIITTETADDEGVHATAMVPNILERQWRMMSDGDDDVNNKLVESEGEVEWKPPTEEERRQQMEQRKIQRKEQESRDKSVRSKKKKKKKKRRNDDTGIEKSSRKKKRKRSKSSSSSEEEQETDISIVNPSSHPSSPPSLSSSLPSETIKKRRKIVVSLELDSDDDVDFGTDLIE